MSEFKLNKDMFGMYAKIPTGFSMNMHTYKIVSSFRSNAYCDVPLVTVNTKETVHNELEVVLNVIHCGIDESEVVRVALKDCVIINNQPQVNQWIPFSERMPKERESMFAKLKDTPNWNMSMFEKYSNEVNVTVEFTDGKRATKTMHTIDGKWVYQSNVIKRIVAWMPLPEPYKDGDSSENS